MYVIVTCYVCNCDKEQKCVTVVKEELILLIKNPFWKANNFSAIQEIRHTLWNQMVFISGYCTFYYLYFQQS
jgi:hypothetical protein